jgi:hypothetical protein
VPKAQLETAMSVFNLTLQASFAVGFAFIGPLLVTFAGPSFVLGVVTVFYAAASLACIGLPSAPPLDLEPGQHRAGWREPLAQLREGFAAVRADPNISRPIVLLAAATSIAGVLGVVGPSLATSVGLEPEHLAVVVVPLGLGVVAGVLGLRRFGTKIPRRRVAEGGLLTLGAMTLAIAGVGPIDPVLREAGIVVGALPLVIGLAFVAGAAYAITSVAAQTTLLGSTPGEVRGRVFGVLASIVSAASLGPSLIAGPLADRVSTAFVIAVAGGVLILIGSWSIRRR